MVNTFLTRKPDQSNLAYFESASRLNKQRLIKQITEAIQILRALENAEIICKVYNLPEDVSDFVSPPSSAQIVSKSVSYNKIFEFYRKQTQKILVHCGVTMFISSASTSVYFSTNSRRVVKISDQEVIFEKLTKSERAKYKFELVPKTKPRDKQLYSYPRSLTVLTDEGDRLIGCGFASHPAARAWIGYKQALANYIASHQFEANRRKTGVSVSFKLAEEVLHPWWTFSDTFINLHKAALLRKERKRDEDPWYQLKKEFLAIDCDPWIGCGYIWPVVPIREDARDCCKLTQTDIDKFLQGCDLDVSKSAPITSDARPK